MKKCWEALFETERSIRYRVTFPATSWKQTKKEAILVAKKGMRKNPKDKLIELKRAKDTEFSRAYR